MTFKDLKEFITLWESRWTEQDAEYLGPLDTQEILCEHWSFRTSHDGLHDFLGYGKMDIILDITGLGFVVIPKDLVETHGGVP